MNTNTIGINGRFRHNPRITGVERVATEITSRLLSKPGHNEANYTLFDLDDSLGRVLRGRSAGRHLWEQAILPLRHLNSRAKLIYNPINTAPLLISEQVIVIHDTSFLLDQEWHSKTFKTYYSNLIPYIAKRARGIITVSQFSKDSITKELKVPPDKIKVIHNGVAPSFRKTIPDRRFHQKYELPDRYILFLGSLDPRKNLSALIKAFSKAKSSPLMDDVELVIAGCSNPSFNELEIGGISTSAEKSIRWIGYVDDADLPSLYSGALVFVFPSLYEGFGLPLIEAMACGTPVIASDVASLPEIVQDAGILVNPNNILDLSDAITSVCIEHKMRESLIEKGIVNSKRFSWESAANETHKFLLQCM